MTKEIQVIDNFLSPLQFDVLKSAIFDGSFPWYYNDHVIYDENNVLSDHFQFTHLFYKDSLPWSNNIGILDKIVEKIDPFALLRIKANLLTQTPSHVEHGMHVDYDDPRITTAVFYINTNNGYTLFETGEKVASVENRIAIFPCSMKHTGSTCTDAKIRIVINFNYLQK